MVNQYNFPAQNFQLAIRSILNNLLHKKLLLKANQFFQAK